MSVLSGWTKVLSSVFERRVFLNRTGVFRSVCSYRRGPTHGLSLTRRVTPSSASCLGRPHHVFPWSSNNTTRFYSEVISESSGTEERHGDTASREESRESETHYTHPGPCDTFTLDTLVALLRQENAVDICVIKVPDHIKYTEHFIVVSGVSTRHLRAMALYAIKVHKFLKEPGESHAKIEGKDADNWMCIDFGKMVVHFMLPEARDEYELEKLWTLRSYDEQLKNLPLEKLPEDFIYDIDIFK